jgi:hypothetical protein
MDRAVSVFFDSSFVVLCSISVMVGEPVRWVFGVHRAHVLVSGDFGYDACHSDTRIGEVSFDDRGDGQLECRVESKRPVPVDDELRSARLSVDKFLELEQREIDIEAVLRGFDGRVLDRFHDPMLIDIGRAAHSDSVEEKSLVLELLNFGKRFVSLSFAERFTIDKILMVSETLARQDHSDRDGSSQWATSRFVVVESREH